MQSLVYQVSSQASLKTLEEQMKVFNEHYAIKSNNPILLVEDLQGPVITPCRGNKITDIIPLRPNPEGKLISATPEMFVLELENVRYGLKYRPNR